MIKHTVAISEPLAPQVLSKAGVPLEDALWFNRLQPRAKLQALAMERGQKILQRVREYMQKVSANHAMPQAV